MQKNWLRLLFSDQNGGSNILPPPIGGRHRLLCFMTNIKVTNMKNTAGKSATPPLPPSSFSDVFVAVFFGKYALIYINLQQYFLEWKRAPSPPFWTFAQRKQAHKLGRCDSYLQNLKLSITHSLTHSLTGVGAIASKNLQQCFSDRK